VIGDTIGLCARGRSAGRDGTTEERRLVFFGGDDEGLRAEVVHAALDDGLRHAVLTHRSARQTPRMIVTGPAFTISSSTLAPKTPVST